MSNYCAAMNISINLLPVKMATCWNCNFESREGSKLNIYLSSLDGRAKRPSTSPQVTSTSDHTSKTQYPSRSNWFIAKQEQSFVPFHSEHFSHLKVWIVSLKLSIYRPKLVRISETFFFFLPLSSIPKLQQFLFCIPRSLR